MNIFNAPLPGTTLRTITEEWKVLSGFHTLMRQRAKLEAEHLRQLHQFQDSIDSNWSKSGAWSLISPVVELWSSQMDTLEECSKVLTVIVEACPIVPSPDEPKEGVISSSKYDQLHGPYEACQSSQKAASSRSAIVEIVGWFQLNRHRSGYSGEKLKPMPVTDRNYRESVVAQRNALRPIAEWHSTMIPRKLEAHVKYAEEMQTCLRDYLVESSKFTSDLVQSISTAQKSLGEFSSLAFIDPSQRSFENESSHPMLQPAVYLNHCLGGVSAEPVLGVLMYLPILLGLEESTKPVFGREEFTQGYLGITGEHFLEAEKESTSFNEVTHKLKSTIRGHLQDFSSLAFDAIGPLLPVGDDIARRYNNGIQRNDIPLLMKPFPIENCRMAYTMMMALYPVRGHSHLAKRMLGTQDSSQLLEDIWRKWDFENHRPLPRGVVRTLPRTSNFTRDTQGGKLIFKKTGLSYNPPQ